MIELSDKERQAFDRRDEGTLVRIMMLIAKNGRGDFTSLLEQYLNETYDGNSPREPGNNGRKKPITEKPKLTLVVNNEIEGCDPPDCA